MKSEVLFAAKIEILFPKREVFVNFPDKKVWRDLPPSFGEEVPETKKEEIGGLG